MTKIPPNAHHAYFHPIQSYINLYLCAFPSMAKEKNICIIHQIYQGYTPCLAVTLYLVLYPVVGELYPQMHKVTKNQRVSRYSFLLLCCWRMMAFQKPLNSKKECYLIYSLLILSMSSMTGLLDLDIMEHSISS